MRQGSEARMQAAGVEEEEVVEAVVSVDLERGLDMAAARCFIALPRARGGHSADPRPPTAAERSYFVQLAMLPHAARQLQIARQRESEREREVPGERGRGRARVY